MVKSSGGDPGLLLLALYLVAIAGLVTGLWYVGARFPRLRELPAMIVSFFVLSILTAIGVAIATCILILLIELPFQHFPVLLEDIIGWFLFFFGSALTAVVLVGKSDDSSRGTVLLSDAPPARTFLNRWIPRGRSARTHETPNLTLAGWPIPWIDETKHFKVLGTTGTGKSTAIREVLSGALSRGDRAVIADPDGSYQKRYYTPERGDQLLNPFNPRAARWDLFAEIQELHDADQLARCLIPDHPGPDQNWRNYARTFVTAVLRQLHRAGEADLAKLYWLLVMAPIEDLRELLAPTPAGPFLGEDNGKFFESVRSVTTVHVAALEHLARQQTGTPLSIRRWSREGKGVLFLPYRAGDLAALRYVISTWMRLAMFQVMNADKGDQKLWFVVDELDALGAIDGLKDALARLRKFGGRCVLGFQSIAQVRGTYGDPEAQTIVENCGNTLILRCSASERGGTAEFASRLIGKREVVRRQRSKSDATGLFSKAQSTRTITEQYITEDAVMASEIEQLPDLTGYLKLASRPEWRTVSLR